MKSIKIFFLATVAIAAGLFSACSDDKYEGGGPGVDGAQVYFPESVATMYSISDDVSSIAIPVNRIVKDEAMTIAILSNDESALFTIPSTVTFAAGKETAELLVTFDRTKLEDGNEYPLDIIINDENNTTPYGNRSIKITVAPWPWESLGTGKFRDDWFCSMFKGGNPEIDVKIHKHKSKKGIYMIEEMYGWNFLTEFFNDTQANIEKGIVTYAPTNITIDCSDPNSVLMPRQFTGITDLDPAYGDYEIAMFQGTSGTLVNGVITFQNEALALVCKAGNQKANKSGLFRIILPGFKAVDYSLSAAYGGMKVGADNETTSAVIDFSYGNDVTGISYVFAAGDVTADADKIAAEIVAGTVENVYEVKNFVKGSKKVSIEAEMTAGMYTVIALSKDETGKLLADEVSASSFYFPGMGGGVPECDVEAALFKVSEYPDAADLVSKYPDYYSIAFEITGTELSSVKTFMSSTRVVDGIEDYYNTTLQKFMEANGTALKPEDLTEIAETGKFWNIFINLETSTSYTLVVLATNTYGKTKVFKSKPFVTSLVPYSGTFAIGEYYMTHKEVQGANEFVFENTFSVKPIPGSTTQFRVADIGYEDGQRRVATYDAAASTLTLNGVIVGREKDGNLFGYITTYYDAAGTMGYGLFSYASSTSKGKDPLVFAVDPATKQLSKMKTDLEVVLVKMADMTSIGALNFFPANTPVTRPSGSSSATGAKMQSVRPVNILFSSVVVPANTKGAFNKRVASAVTINKSYSSDNSVRTLSVKTAQCEPLPKQAGRVAKLKESVNLPVMK